MVQSLIPGHMGNGGQMSCGHGAFVYSVKSTYRLRHLSVYLRNIPKIKSTYRLRHLSVYLRNISKMCSSCIHPLDTIPPPIKDKKFFAVPITPFVVFYINK